MSDWPPEYKANKDNPLEVVIPCRPGKLDTQRRPVYKVTLVKGVVDKFWWECPKCGMHFRRRKACEGHMGIRVNNPGSCEVK